MASQISQPPEALVADYDLWIVPQAEHSRWFSRIDWYLNWQMSKGLAHSRAKPSVELFRVMEETGVKFVPDPEINATPLMVSSIGKVNSKTCVVIDFAKSLRPWLVRIHALTDGLKPKRVRVFLPSGKDSKEAQDIWRNLETQKNEIEFSSDEAEI